MNNKTRNKHVFVARNCARTTGLTAANLNSELAEGEIVILDGKGNLIDTETKAIAADSFRIYQGTHGNSVRVSDLIRKDDLKAIRSTKFVQSVLRKSAFGFNGTSGSIDVIANNSYKVTVDILDDNGYGFDPLFTLDYTSNSTDTQVDIANKLAEVLVQSLESFEIELLKVNVLVEGTGTAANLSLDGVEAVKGSKVISYTNMTATGALPTIGDYIAIDGGVAKNMEAEFDSVYKVTAIDTTNNTVTLNMAYQNETITGANALIVDKTDDAGLMVIGEVQENNLGISAYQYIDFDFAISNSGATTFTDTGVGFDVYKGNGRHEEVANYENVNQGNSDPNSYNMRETVRPYIVTEKNHGYSSIKFEARHVEDINITETSAEPKTYMFFLDRDTYANIDANAADTTFDTNINTAVNANSSSLVNVLNFLFVDAGVLNDMANTVANEGGYFVMDGTFDTGIDG